MFISFLQKGLVFVAILLASYSAFSQKIFRGKVLDYEANMPLPDAYIYWENTSYGTKSDIYGQFSIAAFGDKAALIISFVGYEKIILQQQELNKMGNLEIKLRKTIYQSDEVIVNATRANDKAGMAFSNISKNEISTQNVGQDMPILLNYTPSAVTTSDAGTGIGYTGLRIRGTDATSINITINGIPFNDAESHGVYWVNMPDLASSVSSVQIQRGVGASTNGAGAFGGTINVQSSEFRKKAYGEFSSSVGSFNSAKNTLKFGSGLLNNSFTIDGRLSKITSDGFVDRAFSNLGAYYLSGAYFAKKQFIRLITFAGKEKTYQSWNGVPATALDTARTFNAFTYPNQTDNYTQTHYQLLTTHTFSSKLALNLNLHYTKGKGYYEEFENDGNLLNYGIFNPNNKVPSDIIRQKWLNNDFHGLTYSVDYQSFKQFSVSIGGGGNTYYGQHYGILNNIEKFSEFNHYQWYKSSSIKNDRNVYFKVNFQHSPKLNLYADLQLRKLNLEMVGTASKLQKIDQKHSYLFFNPKAGLTYAFNDVLLGYASIAIGQKEPNRADFIDTQSIAAYFPASEKLIDYEAGLKYNNNNWVLKANGYFMKYKNQLVHTGAINDTGEAIRINIPKSYRAGIELESAYSFSKKLSWKANATFSQNKIEQFLELIPDYEGNYKENKLSQTNLSFSPSLIMGSQIEFLPIKSLNFAFLTKYVGKQFLDNTSNSNKTLNTYLVNDIRVTCHFKPKKLPEITIGAFAYNVLNEKYESNGYTFSYLYENTVYSENYYYPQAGRNFMLNLNIKF